jgi:SAM-dependent methyltransferase
MSAAERPSRRGITASSTRVRLLLGAYASELRPGNKVIDVGFGNGRISRAVSEHFGVDVHGADIENLLTEDIPFYRIVDGVLPVASREYDVAMLNDILHHVAPARQIDVVREALRVAGKVLIFDQAPTLLAKALDVIMAYVVYGGREPLPLSHRHAWDWAALIARETGLTPRVKPVPRPGLYPLRHFAVVLKPAGAV